MSSNNGNNDGYIRASRGRTMSPSGVYVGVSRGATRRPPQSEASGRGVNTSRRAMQNAAMRRLGISRRHRGQS